MTAGAGSVGGVVDSCGGSVVVVCGVGSVATTGSGEGVGSTTAVGEDSGVGSEDAEGEAVGSGDATGVGSDEATGVGSGEAVETGSGEGAVAVSSATAGVNDRSRNKNPVPRIKYKRFANPDSAANIRSDFK